ncbi:uncharacterized protein [Panulirus ornatus]|uniref:uncharacterized protein n=1 Tax=Panulirus ornatus TaxID=150431 RepID=UPI003A8ACBCF
MRVAAVIVAWAAWACASVMVSEGVGLASSLPEAGHRLRSLQAKLSKLTQQPEARRRDGLPDQHISQMWSSWDDGIEASAGNTLDRRPPGQSLRGGSIQEVRSHHAGHLLELRSPGDKIRAIRENLVNRIMMEAKQLPSNNQSIMSIAFLAFGVILFDVLGDAMFGGTSNLLAALGVNPAGPQAKEAILPGLGLLGDNVNNLMEVVLNIMTIYLYRDESPDCGERLLCETNQQAVRRGFFDSLVTYVSGFAVSFFLHEAPLSRNLEAMRAGRKGQDCIEMYPRCSITL